VMFFAIELNEKSRVNVNPTKMHALASKTEKSEMV